MSNGKIKKATHSVKQKWSPFEKLDMTEETKKNIEELLKNWTIKEKMEWGVQGHKPIFNLNEETIYKIFSDAKLEDEINNNK